MRRAFIQGMTAAAACLAVSSAWASAAAAITVSDLRVTLSSLSPGATPAVSFVGDVGTTSTSDGSAGDPATDQHQFVASGRVFGDAATSVAGAHAGGAASLSGDAFGSGALISTSAWADSNAAQTSGDGTIGLVDDVATAAFTLAPWTLMTISASVLATASCSGTSPFEFADSGLLMAIGDDEGTGPQFAYVNFNAFAFGALGAATDTEATFVSLTYENASDAAIQGLFSGYVASSASSAEPVGVVPEPAISAMWCAALLAAAARFAWRRSAPRK